MGLRSTQNELFVPDVMSVKVRTPRGASSRRKVSPARIRAALDAQ